MFEERAERAGDPISRQHYREMAAHYRSLSVEHQEVKSQPDTNRRTDAQRIEPQFAAPHLPEPRAAQPEREWCH